MKGENIEDIYGLSPMQQGMLFHSLYAPDSGLYIEQNVYSLIGKLNIPAFISAWEHILIRYSVLRTAFYWQEHEKPLQVVYRHVGLPFEEQDWRELSPMEQERRLKKTLLKRRKQGFEFSKAPLMHLKLIRRANHAYYLIWSWHHILLDRWSQSLVFEKVFTLYETFCKGYNPDLKRTYSYGEFIAWLHRQDLSKAEKFWQKSLKGLTGPISLGNDKFSNWMDEEKKKFANQTIKLSEDLTTKLQSFVKQYKITLNCLVQSVWALLLARYSGEEDILFGVTISGRTADIPGIESMVGLFINTLPMRIRVSPKDSLLSLLTYIHSQQLQLQQYGYSALTDIHKYSEFPPKVPLFESILVFENTPVSPSALNQIDEVKVSKILSMGSETNYPLNFAVHPGMELQLKIIYDCSRFDDASITRMFGHFQKLLKSFIRDPKQGISTLPILTEAERRQILLEWNATQTNYPKDKTIHQLLEEQAAKTPGNIAVVYEEKQLTYQELNERANQLAHHLKNYGVGPEVLVAFYLERSLDMVVGLLGILKAGGAYVPLDSTAPKERLTFMLEDTEVPVVLTQQQLVEKLAPHNAHMVCLDTDWDLITQENRQNPNAKVKANNLAYVIYTSGSTGKPKGVCCNHVGIINLLTDFQNRQPLAIGDRCSTCTSFSFDVSVYEIFSPLMSGGTLYITPESLRPNSQAFVEWLRDHHIRGAYLPTFMLTYLADWLKKDSNSLALRRLLVGVDPISEPTLAAIHRRLPQLKIINGYGPTEATICATLYNVNHKYAKNRNTPIGRPVQNMQIYLLDKHCQPVPTGVPGELHIAGIGLARGYLNRPIINKEKFISNPFSDDPDARIYKTGDLARYLPDGNIEFIGRMDTQIKIRGFRIELREIEAVLAKHRKINEAIVIATERQTADASTLLGTSKRLIAYFVAKKEKNLSVDELRNFLKRKLPEYMIPTAFVALKTLPLTPNGKIDLKRLPKPELESLTSKTFTAPRNSTEKLIASIWANLLEIKQIGIHHNFFELGGHSLLATQVVSRIKQAFSIEIPLRSLFENPTVAELAQRIETTLWVKESSNPVPEAISDNRNEGEV